MRKVQLLGLAVVAAAAFSAFASASALASAPEWLNNGAAITTPVAVTLKGTVKLSDLKQKVILTCSGTGTGKVGAGKADETSTLTATSCTNEGSTECPSPKAVAQKLPWKTELSGTAPTVDKILSESGWQVTCAGIVKDTCLSTAGTPFVEVTKLSAIVEESFVAAKNENAATCSLGGKEGDVAGTFTVEGGTGNSISIN
jgi:hypothetical protein